MPDPDRDSSNSLRVTIFVLISLLAHAVALIAFLLAIRYAPAPPPTELASTKPPEVTLSLEEPPPPRQIFLPTAPDNTAKPNPKTPVISDNNSTLKSQNQAARKPDAPLPDVAGQKNHSLDLNTSPYVPPTPPTQAASASPSKPTQQAQTHPPQPQPAKPTPPKPPDPTPPKPPAQQVAKTTFDPDGLPVLPPIAAPTIEPQTPVTTTQQVKNQTAARPPPSFQLNKSDISGAAGIQGANSVAANATELGRYKAKVYRAVGARWYEKVGQPLTFQTLPTGVVRIQYTIHSDGTVDTKILEGTTSTLQMLLSISLNSITEAAPFDPFSEGMRKEVGDSYTDDFTFQIYGG